MAPSPAPNGSFWKYVPWTFLAGGLIWIGALSQEVHNNTRRIDDIITRELESRKVEAELSRLISVLTEKLTEHIQQGQPGPR